MNAYHSADSLFKGNFGKLLTSLRASVGFWSKLLLSAADRVALSKMVVLPRFLYPFAALPLSIATTFFFREVESLLLQLIWGNGRHRIALSKIETSDR